MTATVRELKTLLDELEGKTKSANYDSTTTSHPSGSLEDGTGPVPGDGAPGKDMNATVNGQSPAVKPVGEMADASPAKTTTLDNPVDAPAAAVGAGAKDTVPAKKDSKDDPGTSVPDLEVGEKYAKMSTSELCELFGKKANVSIATLIKAQVPATTEPAKTETVKTATDNQVAAAAGYAAAADVGTVEKRAAAQTILHRTISDTMWAAREVAKLVKKANDEMMVDPAAGGGMPPPAAGGMPPAGPAMPPPDMGAPAGPPMGDPAAAGGMPPAGGDPAAAAGPAGAGGGGDPLGELISAILEAGYSPQDIEAALQAAGGGGGASGGMGGDSLGGGSPPAEAPKEAPKEGPAEEKTEKESNAKLLKQAVAFWKSGKFSYVPATDAKSKARRTQLKQAVIEIVGRR